MTLAEIEKMDTDFLTVQQVAECMRMSPQLIRDQAEREVRWLGFPICRAGHAFRIPRAGFVAWAKGETPAMMVRGEFDMMVGGDAN